jgi:hypothetical protein
MERPREHFAETQLRNRQCRECAQEQFVTKSLKPELSFLSHDPTGGLMLHQKRSRCRDDDAGCTRITSPWPLLFPHSFQTKDASACHGLAMEQQKAPALARAVEILFFG